MHCLQAVVGILLCYGACAQFFPPVNQPNDCPIRCVTTPCPCGTNCTQLECPSNCLRWRTDSRGCNTCDCERVRCPVFRCRPCPNGYQIDEDGCQTCQCKNLCPIPRCAEPCPNGFRTNSRGCQTCECVSGEHAGECPAPSGLIGICVAECTTDDECASNEKCCGSCPRRCTPAVNVNKPGSCPRERPGQVGPCVVECEGDNSCPGDEKCCGGCPRRCTAAVNVNKPGRCPRERPGQAGPCVVECEGDDSCPGDEKCCGSCPKQCKKPRSRKPIIGRSCPSRFTTRAEGRRCTERRRNLSSCTSDSDCEDGRVCCGFCRKRCMRGRARFARS
ncbi:cysteine-rich motor neuron 1 protein-like isoform X1 [Watersipora subatra]|uniref:cysteine-rich motor neuron 1 protein-like isoform X1 n=1 Tax=Watersipora subatra TaxID=2589382 RepID=UPI00355B486C